MGNIFNYESPIMCFLKKLWQLIILSFLWVICSLPILTFGVATCALFSSINKLLVKGEGYTTEVFFSALKENFKQMTLIWSGIVLLLLLFDFNASYMNHIASQGSMMGEIHLLFRIQSGILLIYFFWSCAYVARFKDRLKSILINCGILMISQLKTTLLIFFILVTSLLNIWVMPFSIFIVPAVAVWVINFKTEKIFYKCMTSE